MKEYMLFDMKPLTPEEIDAAVQRAHQMRSAAAIGMCSKIVNRFFKLFHSNAPKGSELAHSS